MKQRFIMGILCAAAVCLAGADIQGKKIKKDKLQIVFCFGQSNMVGMAEVKTAWYLTQPQYVPPKDIALKKSKIFNWGDLYWQGVRTFEGPQEMKDQLKKLVDERGDSRAKWRGRVKSKTEPWNEAEWGPKPKIKNRDDMYAFLDKKAVEEGIYARMAKILDSPENKFPAEKAYEEIANRDTFNAGKIKLAREIYVNGTKGEDFDAFNAAVKKAFPKDDKRSAEVKRTAYAKLAESMVNLPIAKRTYLAGFGAIAGSKGEGITSETNGILSIGYGADIIRIGPEYGIGIMLEKLVDAPILLVKCAWGNTTVNEAWRPGSLDGVETPTEKAMREAWNQKEIAKAKAEGREPKLRQAPKPKNKLSWCWSMTLPFVKKVLADPGKYYPGYDPKVGYDIAGMVWFQGYSDAGNKAYGEQLTEMIKWFRKEINAPNMPVVCGSMGVGGYNHTAFLGAVNSGMVYASQAPGLKGTVDVVNTARYFPAELGLLIKGLHAYGKDSPEYKKLIGIHLRANSNHGFHYYGSAKFMLLAGDDMAHSLANLMAGGKPNIDSDPFARPVIERITSGKPLSDDEIDED